MSNRWTKCTILMVLVGNTVRSSVEHFVIQEILPCLKCYNMKYHWIADITEFSIPGARAMSTYHTCQKSLSCSIHFSVRWEQYPLFMSQMFLVWQSEDISWVYYVFSSQFQLYNVLLIGPNVEMCFNLTKKYCRITFALEELPLGKMILDLGFTITYSIDFCFKGTSVHSREFSISSCFRTWHEKKKNKSRNVANILLPPLSDLSLSTLRQGTSHPLCYTPASKNQWGA